ncbi:MAG: cobalamin-binding protein [Lysobacterales bacterium]
MTIHRIRLCLCLAFLLLALDPAAVFAEIELTQADGGVLELPGPANRIVTLSPHLTELVFAAGAGARIVATVAFSEYPAAAADIPRVGDAFRLDIERIVSLKPDLVIAWQSGNPQAAVAQLGALDIAVWSVEIREPAEIPGAVEAIGRAADTAPAAQREADMLRRRLASLSTRYRGAERVDYFYQVDAKPLFTISGKHLISKGLDLCGGRNVFADESGLAFQVSHESVIVADPAAILAPSGQGLPDPLAAWRAWPALRAVRQNALFLLPADEISRATPRFLDALEIACVRLDGVRKGESHG